MSHQVSSDDLNQTAVTAHLEAEIVPGKNLLYCAAFQIAWNQLVDDILKAPLQLKGDPQIAQALNKCLVGQGDIAEECYLAMAGFGRDGIVGRIERALREKFNQAPGLDLTLQRPDDILAYAFLEKSLPFDTEFEAFDEPLTFSDGAAVQAFGIESDRAALGQVVIVDYNHNDDFLVKLQADARVDEEIEFGFEEVDRARITDDIILAKVRPQATLLETIESVLHQASKEGQQQARRAARKTIAHYKRLSPRLDIDDGEVLRIPKINFDLLHRYSELIAKSLLNKGFEGYFIAEALQAIKFKLDEKGAELRSEVEILATLGIIEKQPRLFIFDKPFLLLLKEREAQYPYLAVWVDNSELLVKA